MAESHDKSDGGLLSDHSRKWHDFRYVYPVLSRRSKGLSLGVNLNPDKSCSFSCIYCQVRREAEPVVGKVDTAILRDELACALPYAITGRIWREGRFAAAPADMRRVNDIAFSGDGEPTCPAEFDRAVELAAETRRKVGADDVKLVLITNAAHLHLERVRRGLAILDANNGEIWAKLDAGTQQRFNLINRPREEATFGRVLRNITDAAIVRPIVIQSLFFSIDGAGPADEEIAAYCRRLDEIVTRGGRIKLVQIHTIARPPASALASALSDAQLEAIVDKVRSALPTVTVEGHCGMDVPPQERAGAGR